MEGIHPQQAGVWRITRHDEENNQRSTPRDDRFGRMIGGWKPSSHDVQHRAPDCGKANIETMVDA